MIKVAYDKINKFCNSKDETISQPIRDHMYRKFSTNLFKSIEEKEKNGRTLTQKELEGIRDTLLVDNLLDDLLLGSKSYELEIKEQYNKDFEKSIQKTAFFKSIGIGLLANFFYSLLLIIIFAVAKDYIASLLTSLIKTK